MLYDIAVIVGLEGGKDALVHWLSDEGGVGWQENQIDGLEGAADVGMGSAVVQDEGHLPLLSGEDPALLVKPGAEEVASHPGLLAGVELHWQLMDIDPLLANGVWLLVMVDDQGLQLVGASHVG